MRQAVACLNMALQDICPLKGGTAQDTAVWAFRGVRGAVSLQMLPTLVRLEADGAAMESRDFTHIGGFGFFRLMLALVVSGGSSG